MHASHKLALQSLQYFFTSMPPHSKHSSDSGSILAKILFSKIWIKLKFFGGKFEG